MEHEPELPVGGDVSLGVQGESFGPEGREADRSLAEADVRLREGIARLDDALPPRLRKLMNA